MNALAETFRFARDVIREFTWQKLLLVQVLAVVTDLIIVIVLSLPATAMFDARLVISEIVALSILLAVMIGDQSAARGMRPLFAYALALVAMSFVGSLAQFQLRGWLGIFKTIDEPNNVEAQIQTIVYVASDILSYGAVFVLIYLDHHRRLRLTRQIAVAEFERARYEQQTVDSRMAALHAEIDPIEVIGRLEGLRQMYARDATRAEQMLDEFAAHLRPKLVQPTERIYASATQA